MKVSGFCGGAMAALFCEYMLITTSCNQTIGNESRRLGYEGQFASDATRNVRVGHEENTGTRMVSVRR